ncbi:MAG: hypothetical protein KDI88_17070 [Gammaproteobacteria bacterium]|nr:hypothetical protein [Gammaproteobacteria bacterium]
MTRAAFGLIGMMLAGFAHAGLLISAEDAGSVSQQYFGQSEFVAIEQGQPTFGIDPQGNCWFLDGRQLVTDPCDRMLSVMGGVRDQAMAGLDPRQRAMMEQMMGAGRNTQAVRPQPITGQTIAGYASDCYQVGSERRVCVSESLMREVMAAVGDARFIERFRDFSRSAAEMSGGPGTTEMAVNGLYEKGYPMLDQTRAASIPGIDPAMLRFLPENQRAQIMQQIGGGAAAVSGSQVVKVEKGASRPALGLSGYTRVGFQEYMQRNMGGMGRR